jgi:hypothetical protein
MNLRVALGETASVLKCVDGIDILVTPDCLDSWETGASPLS